MEESQINPISNFRATDFQVSKQTLKFKNKILQGQGLTNQNKPYPKIRIDYRKLKEQENFFNNTRCQIDSPLILEKKEKNFEKSYLNRVELMAFNEKWNSFKKTQEQLIKMAREEKKQKQGLKKDSIPENHYGKWVYEIIMFALIVGYVFLMIYMILRDLFFAPTI